MKEIRELLAGYLKEIITGMPEYRDKLPERIEILNAARKDFGDYSSNVAFRLAGKGANPRPTAQAICEAINASLPSFLEKAEEKNSFINFFVRQETQQKIIARIFTEGERFGSSADGGGKKVLVEFVSANPTGPLTIAHGRQAAFGESLARILSFAGYGVTREYYLNDGGRQINLLGESLKARYEQLHGRDTAIPEDGYQGEYLVDIAKKITEAPEDPEFFRETAVREILEGIRKDLADFGVSFDNWVREKTFLEAGKVTQVLDELKKKELLYFQDGSWWFKSTSLGDDKDRVVIKSDGSYTYLAPDMAYHRDKISRGYDRLVNMWGPDHYGYIPRLKAAVEAQGFPPEKLHVIIVQLTTLYRGEEKLRMSTRSGEFITLRQLMDEVGPDASKFFFIFRRAESHLDFDLEVAKKQSVENPVFYLQYAYVRMRHVLHYAEEKGITAADITAADVSLLREEQEAALIKRMADFPGVIRKIGVSLEVHLLAEYLLDLSKLFHSYYHHCRIVTEDEALTRSRLALTQALHVVFSRALNLLNISLPERM